MKFSTVLSLVLSAAVTIANPIEKPEVAVAVRTENSDHSIEKRELGGILLCTGSNAEGKCNYNVYKMDKCYNLPTGFKGNTSTFAPDGEPFYCFPYLYKCGGICTSPEGCTLGHISFNSTKSKYDLAQYGWNTYIQSFECHAGHIEPNGYCCDT